MTALQLLFGWLMNMTLLCLFSIIPVLIKILCEDPVANYENIIAIVILAAVYFSVMVLYGFDGAVLKFLIDHTDIDFYNVATSVDKPHLFKTIALKSKNAKQK